MVKFVVGEVYQLHTPAKPSISYYSENGYLWIHSYYEANEDRYYFKSIATGKVDWWPRNWMEGLD